MSQDSITGNDYEVFEKLPDGNLIWHGSFRRLEEVLLRMAHLRTSIPDPNHEFFAVFSTMLLPIPTAALAARKSYEV